MLDQSSDSIGCLGFDCADQAFLRQACEALNCDLVVIEGDELAFTVDRAALPQSMIGLIVHGDVEDARLQRFEGILSESFVLRLQSAVRDDEIALIRAIATARGSRYRRLAKAYVDGTRSLSNLRRLFDDSQRAFVELERYLQRHALLRIRTTFAVTSGSDSIELRPGADALQQPLPFDPFGLALLKLVLSSSLGSGSAIEAELLLGDDIVQRWLISGPLPSGSVSLPLNGALTEQFRVPSLRLRAIGQDAVVCLALSAQRLGPRWSARQAARDLNRALALSTGFAPPGISLPSMAPTTQARFDTERFHVIVDAWNGVDFAYEPVRHDWQVVQAEEGFLQAHPLAGAPTVIRLRNIDLTGFRRIRADMRLAHANAPRIGFAVALLDSSRSRKLNLRDKDLSWSDISSDWFVLQGEESGLAFLEFEGKGRVDIALVTSCLDKNADFAWARWGPIVLER